MLEAGLYTYVVADTTMLSLVSTRVYPVDAPQDVTRPYVVFQRISTNPVHDLTGPDGLVTCRVQFDSYGETLLSAKTVSAAVRSRIDGYRGSMGTVSVRAVARLNERDLSEPTTGWYRVSADYRITYWET